MNWKKGPVIGRGSTATVSLATTVTKDVFAVKSTDLSKSSFLQKEQQLLSKLSSPYIIEYIGFDVDYADCVPMYNMFIEYAPGGTIQDLVKQQGGSLDECVIRSYTHNILLGLDYLHSNNLVHCDIKCANILVCEDGVKIGDLGCAKFVDTTSSVISGTPIFMAPEVARGEKQGFAADVWAVGCAVVEMATGSNPWVGISDPVSALYKIGYSEDVPMFPVWLSDEAKDFLSKCLQRKDEARWTVKELLEHPFVNLNSSFKKVENVSKHSPSSILDQGFWDSFKISDSSLAPTRFTTLSNGSPVDRIKQLVEENSNINFCLPNWVDEEDWFTVRTSHLDENLYVTNENLYTHEDMEDNDSESIRSDSESDSELYVQEGFSSSVRITVESNVVEATCLSVANSRFIDLKQLNDDDNCLLVNINLNFAILVTGSCINSYLMFFYTNSHTVQTYSKIYTHFHHEIKIQNYVRMKLFTRNVNMSH